MQIELVTSTQAFDALEADWRALESLSAHNSVFLGWDWQRLWWTYYGNGRQLQILVARLAGRVLGIFPLYLETHQVARIIRVRKLRPIGAGGDTAPDDLGMVFSPEHEHALSAAFIGYITQHLPGWQMLDLVDLPADSALAAGWTAAAVSAPGLIERTQTKRITYGDLPTDWELYRQGLSRDRRQALARYRRKFEQLPGARCHQVLQADDVDSAFDRLAALHSLRWQGRTQTPSFASAQYLGFHRAMMHALHAAGRLRLFALECGGETIAMLYGFRHGDTFFHFQGGFDPAHAALSPGQVLMTYAIEQAIAEGCTVFDTLKGDYGHKRHFFQQTRQTVDIRVHRPGLIHLLYRVKQWRLGRAARTGQGENKNIPAQEDAPSTTALEPGK
jgi:CelD/BcsL family acetyltransferase involved in cellulose biosynthesis